MIDTVSVTSDPGADETYAIGDTIEVTVTFDQEVTVTGGPRITLRVGGGGPEHMRSATYADAFSVALLALRFTYGVAEGDGDDDGIDLKENELKFVGGGTIQGAADGLDAILTYPAPGTQAGQKVDGRRPTPTGAVVPVSGETITLTFSETVSSTTAAPGAFAVTVGPGAPSVSSVAATGQDVTLTLARVVAEDQPVSVTYTDPSAGDDPNAVQDAAGNDAKTFTQPVTNNSEHISTGPDFGAATATRAVAENSPAGTDVGDPVDATATNPLTYSLAGTDAAAFTIVSTSGQIRTTAGVTYDHEAAKNAYAVTVTADDGTDGADATATVAVTINVTDVRERPSPPARPTVRGTAGEESVTLEVSWREPENTGPPITDYDVRVTTKARAAEGAWLTWTHQQHGHQHDHRRALRLADGPLGVCGAGPRVQRRAEERVVRERVHRAVVAAGGGDGGDGGGGGWWWRPIVVGSPSVAANGDVVVTAAASMVVPRRPRHVTLAGGGEPALPLLGQLHLATRSWWAVGARRLTRTTARAPRGEATRVSGHPVGLTVTQRGAAVRLESGRVRA